MADDQWADELRRAAGAYAWDAFDIDQALEPTNPPSLPYFIADRYNSGKERYSDGRACSWRLGSKPNQRIDPTWQIVIHSRLG